MPIQQKYLLKGSTPFTITPGKDAAVSLALTQGELQQTRPVYISFCLAVKKGRKKYKQRIRIKLARYENEPYLSQISSRQKLFNQRTKSRKREKICHESVGVKLFVSVRKGAQLQRQRYSVNRL
ncbi:hypothetical protein [Paenibacillus lentus]|uniref:Uncharacterized protein n=1 Tax=Paenibacillus lentus TaxID=1338368 RepID=A0A3Q8SDG9_9BACL|nr:hypothetical protein [Paenibacillus lentus]AZK48153.1 hypothetical protein EIM92_19895 [Paenibacillus lentus]